MFRITCPHCQVALRADDRSHGQTIRCPKCNQTINIPVAVQVPAPTLAPNCVADMAKVEEKASAVDAPDLPPFVEPADQPAKSGSASYRRVSGCVDAEGKPLGEKRTIRKRRTGERETRDLLMGCGLFLCIVGCLITLGYWVVYSTTVGYENVHNVGLMNNRIVGTIVGVGMALGGLIMWLSSTLLDSLLRHLRDREDDEL